MLNLLWGFNGAATIRSRKPNLEGADLYEAYMLQWGRDYSIAETAPGHSSGGPLICFNGAATIRSRKLRTLVRLAADDPASMGPRPFDRGNCFITLPCTGTQKASMGPRPFDRGNMPNGEVSTKPPHMLQWGRDHSIAETASLGPLPALIDEASMGPRPFDRGNGRGCGWR